MGQTSSSGVRGEYIASVFHKQDAENICADRVNGLALSKDGSIVVSAGTLSIAGWDVASARNKWVIKALWGNFTCIAVSKNVEFIVAGAEGVPDVLLFTKGKGGIPAFLKGHTAKVCCVALSPAEDFIYSGSADSTIRIWKIATGTLEGTLEGHKSDVLCLVIAAEGDFLASGSTDYTIKLWNLEKREHVYTLTSHEDAVKCITFSPDGLNLVSGSADHSIRLWHRRTGLLKGELNAEQDEVCSLQFSCDGKLLISGGGDGTVKVWNFARGILLHTYRGHLAGVTSIVSCPFSPSLVRFISGSADETVKFWPLPLSDGSPPYMQLHAWYHKNATPPKAPAITQTSVSATSSLVTVLKTTSTEETVSLAVATTTTQTTTPAAAAPATVSVPATVSSSAQSPSKTSVSTCVTNIGPSEVNSVQEVIKQNAKLRPLPKGSSVYYSTSEPQVRQTSVSSKTANDTAVVNDVDLRIR